MFLSPIHDDVFMMMKSLFSQKQIQGDKFYLLSQLILEGSVELFSCSSFII